MDPALDDSERALLEKSADGLFPATLPLPEEPGLGGRTKADIWTALGVSAVCALLPVTILWALIGVWPGLAVGLAAQAGLIWVGVQFGFEAFTLTVVGVHLLAWLTCTVLVDGKVVQQAHSTPDSSSATCAGSTADTPQRGIPVPALTPGVAPLPEERRLTGTVKVPDYPGEGSPVIGTVTDSSLEYAELGGTWDRSKTLDPVFDGFTRKQEGRQRALVKSTQVDEDIMSAAGGTGELRGLAGAVLDARRRYEYPRDQAIPVDVASQPLKVDGHDAWLLVSEIHFHKRGVPSTMDLNAVLVVDTGRVRHSVLWVVLPETNKKLWPDLNTLVASVQVR
ncbi:hypothetical protein [Streptomyces sp. NPDC085466]|uniref:hypothetical protein n=1 Tax=Streptomyces sp. NPDC085466 TaxID=3365725 RepID=UPI0037CFCA3E